MIERKIEKIINNYLYKKVIHIFKGRALIRGIDLHIIPRKDKVTVYAKDRRFTENLYKEVNNNLHLKKMHLYIIYVI